MRKRNSCIDIIKLLFALCIALGHFGLEIISSDMIVNCFFVLSGYFMMASFESGKYESSFEYIKQRIFKIYPLYFCSVILYMIVWFIFVSGCNYQELWGKLTSILPELFFVQNTAVFVRGGMNGPCWQLSTLFVASYILYGMLCCNKKMTVYVLSPITVLVGYTYWANVFSSHEIHRWGVEFGMIYVPLLRAFSGLCLGIAVYEMIQKSLIWIKEKNIGFTIITTATVVFAGYFWVNRRGWQTLIAFIGILICALSPTGIIASVNRKINVSFEKLSLSIYVTHATVINILGVVEKGEMTFRKALVFCIIVLAVGVLFYKSVDYICVLFNKCIKATGKYIND